MLINVECVLLGRNFYFLGGYLVVTTCYLVFTARYLVVTSGYCSLLVVTARYHSLLFVPTFSMNASKLAKAKNCTLEANILSGIPEIANPLLMFEGNTNLNELEKHNSDQTNLCATQNGRKFATNPEEILAFLGINYIMSISKVRNVKCYWRVDCYLSNDGAKNTMKRNRFMNILQNLRFTDTQTPDKSDQAYKMCIAIIHLNKAFQDAMSNAERQSIDEHMSKCKDRMSCKQYMKNKPEKWGFKWWCRCCSKLGYLYEFDLYLGKKEKRKLGLGETIVFDLSKKLENMHCMLYFDNFFNSPTLVEKLLYRGIYCLGTVRSARRKIWLI